jgi:hypothetical protein
MASKTVYLTEIDRAPPPSAFVLAKLTSRKIQRHPGEPRWDVETIKARLESRSS